MNNNIEGRIVFLLSMPRSGSTLLSMMLGSHAEVCCPPEPWIVLLLAEYLKLGEVSGTPYGRKWAEMASIEFLLNAERKQQGAISNAFGKVGETIGMTGVAAARRLLGMAYQMHLDVSGKRVFVDKTPRYYAALGLIDELFPVAQKIVLLRNPLDIYASYKTTWNNAKNIFTPEGVTVGTRDFCDGLFRLADYTAAHRNDVLAMHYEDLVRDPEGTLRGVCKFVGVDFSPAMLAYRENKSLAEEYSRSPVGDQVVFRQASVRKQTAHAWEARLDPAEVQALIDVLGAGIFERMGYGDTMGRLREMSVNIPSEEQASERRAVLMRALRERVQEPPFSIWENFVLPLRNSQDELKRIRTVYGFLGYQYSRFKRVIRGIPGGR